MEHFILTLDFLHRVNPSAFKIPNSGVTVTLCQLSATQNAVIRFAASALSESSLEDGPISNLQSGTPESVSANSPGNYYAC